MLNVATPLLAVTVVVLPVKLPGPLAMLTVTVSLLSLLTTLPNWSSILTVTAGARATPAVVFVGCTPKTNWFTAAGLTVRLNDVVAIPAVLVALIVRFV